MCGVCGTKRRSGRSERRGHRRERSVARTSVPAGDILKIPLRSLKTNELLDTNKTIGHSSRPHSLLACFERRISGGKCTRTRTNRMTVREHKEVSGLRRTAFKRSIECRHDSHLTTKRANAIPRHKKRRRKGGEIGKINERKAGSSLAAGGICFFKQVKKQKKKIKNLHNKPDKQTIERNEKVRTD